MKRKYSYKPKPCVCCGDYFTVRSPGHKYCELCTPVIKTYKNRVSATRHREKYGADRNAYQRKWYASNPEKAKASNLYGKKWYRDNIDRAKEANKKWALANRDKRRASKAKRRARELKAIPLWFDKGEVEYIFSLAKERNLEVDHLVPLISDIVCGLHVQDNLRCIPSDLNRSKGNRYWPDMW